MDIKYNKTKEINNLTYSVTKKMVFFAIAVVIMITVFGGVKYNLKKLFL